MLFLIRADLTLSRKIGAADDILVNAGMFDN